MSDKTFGKTKAKPTNKLIEAIAEHICDAMCEMLAHAIEYGDTAFVDSVIETLRNFDYTVIDNSDRAAGIPNPEAVRELIEAATALREADPNEIHRPGAGYILAVCIAVSRLGLSSAPSAGAQQK